MEEQCLKVIWEAPLAVSDRSRLYAFLIATDASATALERPSWQSPRPSAAPPTQALPRKPSEPNAGRVCRVWGWRLSDHRQDRPCPSERRRLSALRPY